MLDFFTCDSKIVNIIQNNTKVDNYCDIDLEMKRKLRYAIYHYY